MKVSVITPLYNCSSFLERTIQSVLSQTYHNWEMIMGDDFSKDNSLEVAWLYAGQEQMYGVEKLHKGSRIYCVTELFFEDYLLAPIL